MCVDAYIFVWTRIYTWVHSYPHTDKRKPNPEGLGNPSVYKTALCSLFGLLLRLGSVSCIEDTLSLSVYVCEELRLLHDSFGGLE